MATKKPALFSTEYFGDAAIIRIETATLLDEVDGRRLFDELNEAIGPRSHVVLDLTQVLYSSSVGLSWLIRIHRRSMVRGGQLVLCSMTSNVSEAFRTSNLDRLFNIALSVDEALAALRWSLEIRCPITGCAGSGLSHEPTIADRGGVLSCRLCGCQFRVAAFELPPSGQARVAVSRFAIPTYEEEKIRAELGAIVVLDIVGRLDLFASEALVDAWRSLPTSCCCMLDLRATTELSEPGLCLLEEYLRTATSMDRIAIVVDEDRFSWTHAILSGVGVTTNHDEAMSGLRGSLVSDESPTSLLVMARMADTTTEKPQSPHTDPLAGQREFS